MDRTTLKWAALLIATAIAACGCAGQKRAATAPSGKKPAEAAATQAAAAPAAASADSKASAAANGARPASTGGSPTGRPQQGAGPAAAPRAAQPGAAAAPVPVAEAAALPAVVSEPLPVRELALDEDDEAAEGANGHATEAHGAANGNGAAVGSAQRLHEALEAYQESKGFWERGAYDEAFGALDEAYQRMTEVRILGDPLVAQQKENLRRLIARRLVEIYASRGSAVGDLERSIPRVLNDEVRREIASFQGRERQFFLESYQRSGRHRPMIVVELAKAGLPEALSWLPLVESGFKERALSSARALGLWQFIPSTGYRYGLDRSEWIDERMDPEKATRAAIGYLTDLHELFGDWLTALAAYNCGEKNVLRQIRNQREGYFDQFWDLYSRLPGETRRYVPRFLATLAILDDPAAFGFTLPEPFPPTPFETVEVARAAKLEALDKALGLGAGTLAQLNPELRRGATPKSPYLLRIPPASGATLLASLASLPEWKPPRVEVTVHTVRAGETLSSIARRYRTSVQALVSANHLRSAHRLSIGQRLQVPAGREASLRSGG